MAASRKTGTGIRQAIALSALLPGCTVSYIGAGTGSLIIQVVIAGLAGALIALKIYWRNITALFKRRKEAGGGAGATEAVADPGDVENLMPVDSGKTPEWKTD